MSKKLDFEEALKAIQSGQAITGKDGVLASLVKHLTNIRLHLILQTVPDQAAP